MGQPFYLDTYRVNPDDLTSWSICTIYHAMLKKKPSYIFWTRNPVFEKNDERNKHWFNFWDNVLVQVGHNTYEIK